MVRVRLAAFPDVDLRVDDQHTLLLAFRWMNLRRLITEPTELSDYSKEIPVAEWGLQAILQSV
jgi:hypothetical protein